MQPVILSSTPLGDGLAAVVVSVAPGRRVQLVLQVEGVTAGQLRATIEALITRIGRKGNT